jgi:hypothetical protein
MKSLSLTILISLLIACNSINSKKNNLILSNKKGYVSSSETAIKIAEAVWLPIYGEKIYKKRPFEAELKSDSVWIVRGTLKQGLGGVPYIEIQVKDGKVLKVTHSR